MVHRRGHGPMCGCKVCVRKAMKVKDSEDTLSRVLKASFRKTAHRTLPRGTRLGLTGFNERTSTRKARKFTGQVRQTVKKAHGACPPDCGCKKCIAKAMGRRYSHVTYNLPHVARGMKHIKHPTMPRKL